MIFAFLSVGASFYRKSIFILIAKLFRKKIVISSRGGGFANFYDSYPVLLKQYIKLILNMVDVNIVLGKSEKILFDKISGHDRCVIIHNSVVCPKLSASLDNRPWVVCTMGHLSQAKGTFDLLEAIPLVLREFPEVEFWLCGDGDRAKVNDVIKSKSLERNVKLFGYIVGSEKEEVYLRSSVYVLPSYFEGMPRSILEAMSYGLPVVTTGVNAIPDLVRDGVTGLLIEPGDTDALACKILLLLKNDPLRIELGQNARLRVLNEFDPPTKLLELETVFKRLQ
jgi:glycosyltransferase involved in cell wall biosynthesis